MLNALQINKINYTMLTFPLSNQLNFEDSAHVLTVSISEFYQSVAVQLMRWLLAVFAHTNRQLFL